MRYGLRTCFAWPLLLRWGAEAVVAASLDDEDDSGGLAAGNVPKNLTKFREIYETFLRDEQLPDKSFSLSSRRSAGRVLLGVFSTQSERDREVREIIRNTWLRRPDVCTIDDNATETCIIRVAFVVGRAKRPTPEDQRHEREGLYFLNSEPDVVLLDTKEHMERGKSFAWFQTASRHFAWADYVFKSDEDVFPHVPHIVDALAALGRGCEAYLGRAWTCTKPRECPPRSCGPPLGDNFMQYADTDAAGHNLTDCWSFMQGGLYGLSRPLALGVAAPGGFFDHNKIGPEDAATGLAVAEYARRTGTCVHVRDSSDDPIDYLYVHLRIGNDRPLGVSKAWNRYYSQTNIRKAKLIPW